MVTEFSYRARVNQSGNPNSRGAGGVLETQADRASSYKAFVTDLLKRPMIVGAHWFEWADQSPQGRFDGEDSNYGIVDIHHHTYKQLLSSMRRTNSSALEIHATSSHQMPTELPTRKGVEYRPLQRPDRPPTVSLLENPVAPPEIWHAADARIELHHTGHELRIDYNSGHQYGVGFSAFGPKDWVTPRGPARTTNLDGYEFLVLEATVPMGLQVQLIVNEGGASEASAGTYDLSAGDDAESFMSLPLQSTG